MSDNPTSVAAAAAAASSYAAAEAADPATIWVPPYDPTIPVDRAHQILQLVSICVLNSLTLIIIAGRTWYRGTKLKRYRADDKWIVAAGFLLAFPLFTCQIGTNMYGSGLHEGTIKPEWQEPHWIFSWGWSAAYLVSAMIRVSVCVCLLEILPHSFVKLRRCVYVLCTLLVCLGISLCLIWLFQYRPFMANFDYNTDATYWVPIDPPRYVWAGMSVPIDLGIIAIPYFIIKNTKLQPHERRIIMLVFAAQLLGTITSVFGIWGVWLNRSTVTSDIYYNESVWLILTDLEIFMYTLGATFPIFSRYFIAKAAPNPSQQQTGQLTWFQGAARSLTSRISRRTRNRNSRNSNSYNEIQINSKANKRNLHSRAHPRSESSDKLDTIALDVMPEMTKAHDSERNQTMWLQTNMSSYADTRGDSEDLVGDQNVKKPSQVYSAFD